MIEQSVTSYKQKNFTLESAYKAVERAARICYNSTDKITNDSYKSFIKMLRKNRHTAPFAFGTVHIHIPYNIFIPASRSYFNKITHKTIYTSNNDIVDFFDKLPDSWARIYTIHHDFYITTNLRVLEEWENEQLEGNISVLDLLKDYITDGYPLDYFEERPFVICTTNIAMSREFNRYSSLSICERSTRHVEANQIIKPLWYNENIDDKDRISDRISWIFDEYQRMIDNKTTKQVIRDILPLCTVTEVAYIGFQDDWDWVINQRTSKGAHPQAQELAKLIKEEIYES